MPVPPWPERGEIVALTGHLAENELRGGLTFIERALWASRSASSTNWKAAPPEPVGAGPPPAADGFPVQQSHISRMADAVRCLLPAIPTNCSTPAWGVTRIDGCRSRKACERTWRTTPRPRTGSGLRRVFSGGAVAIRCPGDEFRAARRTS